MDHEEYRIEKTRHADLPFIHYLFEKAIEYQKKKGYNVWKGYDEDNLRKEVIDGLHFKVSTEAGIAAAFSMAFNDPFIWRERDADDAIYLHRIVVNPDFKGQRQFQKILTWAKQEARTNGRSYVRMDTWADNENIINYYLGFGFRVVEKYTTPDTVELSFPYRNLKLALLEIGS